jgi:DNA excision repair protein ERCC-2
VAGRLTYINLNDLAERTFALSITRAEGEAFFNGLADAYLANVRADDDWRRVRDASLASWAFPFAERRAGQDELMEMVEMAAAQGRDLFVEAATGIGKTVAVLYPALKGLCGGDNGYTQVFFLTAKTVGKEILQKTMALAREGGLRLRTVFIEAKERVCLHPGTECAPESCPCARDYYARAVAVVRELLDRDLTTPRMVREAARRAVLCPFELSLDIALHADLIVGDYNYVFDPGVYLRRFFLGTGRKDYLFLVDEAHNLVQRGRDMYSAALSQADLAWLAEATGGLDADLARACAAVDAFLAAWLDEMRLENRQGLLISRLPEMLPPAIERLAAVIERFLGRSRTDPLRKRIRECYFDLAHFTRIAELANRDYAIYVKLDEGRAVLRLFCLNPGSLLRKRLDASRCAIFFSATLSPSLYFRDLLGGGLDALRVDLPSPFPRENRLYLHVPGIDTRYRAREESAMALARVAARMAAARVGNYLMFFPSYAYLRAVQPYIHELLRDKASVYSQTPSMREEEKREFLAKVTHTGSGRSNLGLAVLGGLFGEGIDLPGEKLIGVCIAGPGLPAVNEEQELIQRYFQERNEQGFLYAYLIPGLIRVIQSAGRVFRSAEDRGVVVLVDDRFLVEQYQELLPPDWYISERSFSREDYRRALKEFWGEVVKG